ncbi:MAG: PrsW family intramembrane metalloprotease [Oscillospiraceae bacterium]|nr:PrsW family intramembrane metalloprotease [Oscillospiraceae bacterium]
MYYFLAPFVTYHAVLIAAAIIPAIFLMVHVYRLDRLEKEDPRLLWELVKAGIFSSLIALVEERVLGVILDMTVAQNTVLYNVILYFGIVAFAEESSKYIMLKRRSWHSPEFNCQYDGVIYAVFVSLGFALWENISYVMMYGFGTAVVRAVTAIPGHACFGVFMGVFYAAAKKFERIGWQSRSKSCRVLAVLVPALLHGAYDYIATTANDEVSMYFVFFVLALFVASYVLIGKAAKTDEYMM